MSRVRVSYHLGVAALFVMSTYILVPSSVRGGSASAQETKPQPPSPGPQPESQETKSQETNSQAQQSQELPAPGSNYDKTIFQKPVPSDQLAFLNQFAGAESKELARDKQFRKLMHSVVPDCMFHYGHDMPLYDALEIVLNGSTLPVQLRDGRYLTVAGHSGPYLAGRGFLWIDLQDGIALGGFFFHPTNGEPTPTVNVFSRQVREDTLALSELPPAFAQDLAQWSAKSGVPPVTTRYFITGSNKKILLEHDEDYCVPAAGAAAPAENDCQQMNADSADIDMSAASYLEQTHHATNATAWMITSEDQIVWVRVRDNTCGIGPFPLLCRIRMTRERTHVIIRRHPAPHRR